MIVYADFTCPECYLASRRVDALRASGIPVDWRAVERQPRLPVTGRRLSADEQAGLAQRLAEQLLPGERVPLELPALLAKTEAAVSAYAESCGVGAADEVRRLLFCLYWSGGADIGNPTVLRTPLAGPFVGAGRGADPLRYAGYAVTPDRGPVTTDAYRRIRVWRDEWRRLGSPELPVLVDGSEWTGPAALRRLGTLVAEAGVAPIQDVEHVPDYPRLHVQPHPSWVSRTGGRWRFSHRSPLRCPTAS